MEVAVSLELWFRDPLNYFRVKRKLEQFFRGCREADDLIQETYKQVLELEKEGKIVVRTDQIFLTVARYVRFKYWRGQGRSEESLDGPDERGPREVRGPDVERVLDLLIYKDQLAAAIKLSKKEKSLLDRSFEAGTEEYTEEFGMYPKT